LSNPSFAKEVSLEAQAAVHEGGQYTSSYLRGLKSELQGQLEKWLSAVIPFASRHTAKTVISVTKFRDVGHLP
jgi:hypothetical protein